MSRPALRERGRRVDLHEVVRRLEGQRPQRAGDLGSLRLLQGRHRNVHVELAAREHRRDGVAIRQGQDGSGRPPRARADAAGAASAPPSTSTTSAPSVTATSICKPSAGASPGRRRQAGSLPGAQRTRGREVRRTPGPAARPRACDASPRGPMDPGRPGARRRSRSTLAALDADVDRRAGDDDARHQHAPRRVAAAPASSRVPHPRDRPADRVPSHRGSRPAGTRSCRLPGPEHAHGYHRARWSATTRWSPSSGC